MLIKRLSLSLVKQFQHSKLSGLSAGFLFGVLLFGAVLAGGSALAQSASSGVIYTGCLKAGTLKNVAVGIDPFQPCGSGEVQVSWNADGPSGLDGATWLSGAGSPTTGLGNDDDLYLDLDTGRVFVRQAGTWVLSAILQGPAGPQGPQGEQGPPGPPGGISCDLESRIKLALPTFEKTPACVVDTDGDGLEDEVEITLGTDPANPDTDGDTLTDGEEVNLYSTDPLSPDPDEDGLTDDQEIVYGTNPHDLDSDDCLYEPSYNGDLLLDGEEVNSYLTDPLDSDTDDDGLCDGEEIHTTMTDPLDSDTDDDGLSDGEEVLFLSNGGAGTNPLDWDTDDDGFGDGDEINAGTDPNDPNSHP